MSRIMLFGGEINNWKCIILNRYEVLCIDPLQFHNMCLVLLHVNSVIKPETWKTFELHSEISVFITSHTIRFRKSYPCDLSSPPLRCIGGGEVKLHPVKPFAQDGSE
jgi:hypothetical protein